jgi:hypothetical protein
MSVRRSAHLLWIVKGGDPLPEVGRSRGRKTVERPTPRRSAREREFLASLREARVAKSPYGGRCDLCRKAAEYVRKTDCCGRTVCMAEQVSRHPDDPAHSCVSAVRSRGLVGWPMSWCATGARSSWRPRTKRSGRGSPRCRFDLADAAEEGTRRPLAASLFERRPWAGGRCPIHEPHKMSLPAGQLAKRGMTAAAQRRG